MGETVPIWRKSSYSQNEGACVEVHGSLHGLRDSKNPQGAALNLDVSVLVVMLKDNKISQ